MRFVLCIRIARINMGGITAFRRPFDPAAIRMLSGLWGGFCFRAKKGSIDHEKNTGSYFFHGNHGCGISI